MGDAVLSYLLTNCRNFDYRRPYVPACAPKYIPLLRLAVCVRMYVSMCVGSSGLRVRLGEQARCVWAAEYASAARYSALK